MNSYPVPHQCRPLMFVETPGQRYQSRPGAYALIFNTDGELLVIREKTGFFLPGGGQDEGESLSQTLHREIQEELGAELKSCRYLLAADDCRFSPVYRTHFRIEGHYFLAQLETPAASLRPEPGASLHWLAPEDVMEKLLRKNEQWMLSQLSGDIHLLTENEGICFGRDSEHCVEVSLAGHQPEISAVSGDVDSEELIRHVNRVFRDRVSVMPEVTVS